tara:strand:- start:66 stop:542 length:477 start_codon:yes stop_codon:yes gene_type:complete
MFLEIDNFLDRSGCDFFSKFHKENYNKLPENFKKSHRKTEVIKFENFMSDDRFKYLYSKIVSIAKSINENYFPNYLEIVRWPKNEYQSLHNDFNYHPLTSIIYLNDDFKGGETIVDGKKIEPKKGKLIFFNGFKLKHEVSEITQGERFTIICWYKEWS